jgi:gliding motility-associated-like protein
VKRLNLLISLIASLGFAQTCPNIGFENGDLSGWEGETGLCCPIGTSNSGIINGRHTITSGTGTDPFTNNVVTVVAPGSNYSARLGNSFVGAEAERMRYTMTVSPDNVLFIYKYAVVLEDPGHPFSDQPRFQLRVLDLNGDLIDPICAEYTVVSAPTIPGFVSIGGIRYKDWTTVGLDLTPFMGQTIQLEFSTGDCAQGGHFGYAYVDASCGPLEITSNYCTNAINAELTAPEGFEYLWNTGETTRSITVNNPIEGTTFTCMLTSVTGCQVELSTALEIEDPIADFELDLNCYDNVVMADTSFIPPSVVIENFEWDFGDGTTFSGVNATHTYAAAGDYTITLDIYNSTGCVSNISKTVTVYAPPTSTLSYANPIFCESSGPQPPTLTGTGAFTGGVYSSTAGLDINPSSGIITPTNSVPGVYTVDYAVPQYQDCPSFTVSFPIEITPLPTAVIDYGALGFCEDDSTTITPGLTGTNNFLGGSFSSTTELSIDTTTGAINPSLSEVGLYTVQYTTVAFGGCPPQDFTTQVEIYPLPTLFLDDGFICVDDMGNVTQDYLIQAPLNNVNYSYRWFFNGSEIAGETSNFIVVDQAGTYSVEATENSTQCSSVLESCSVVSVAPFDDFTMQFTRDGTLGPTLEVTPIGSGSYLYQIDSEPLQSSNIFPELPSGIYDITVYDDKLCHQMTKRAIVIDYPRFFTPNGDGYNDRWNLKNITTLTGIKISIFNRYGKLMAEIRPEQLGWDGLHKGYKLPADDYWFKVNYDGLTDPADTVVWKEFIGHFSLRR